MAPSSRGLGHGPFKAATRVRIPSGSLCHCCKSHKNGSYRPTLLPIVQFLKLTFAREGLVANTGAGGRPPWPPGRYRNLLLFNHLLTPKRAGGQVFCGEGAVLLRIGRATWSFTWISALGW